MCSIVGVQIHIITHPLPYNMALFLVDLRRSGGGQGGIISFCVAVDLNVASVLSVWLWLQMSV